jgi:hypothetical protein
MSAPSLPEFAALVGMPLRRWQVAALALAQRMTVIVAPRQTGKSYSLALLAAWWAFTKPGQTVLIVSAGDDAAKRLLGMIRQVAAHPLLRGSTVDESQSLLTLTNGSTVRSVPQSERAVRGWSVDLLLVDEAAMVSEDVLLGAALPTTAARPDARIVLASSPWATAGAFYRFATADTPGVVTFQWALRDADWIAEAVIEQARATLPPLRFAAEFEGRFVGREDAYFDPDSILRAVAAYAPLQPEQANGEAVVLGLDHGRAYDRHAIVALGVLDDYGRNEQPLLFVPYAETSQRSYPDQMAVIVGLARPRPRGASWQPRLYDPDKVTKDRRYTFVEDTRYLAVRPASVPPPEFAPGYGVVQVVSEMNGVGYGVTEELQARLRGTTPVVGVHTTQRSKEEWMARLRSWLGQGRLVLPDDEELLRHLRGLSSTATESGGLSIAASNPAIHDDIAMALALAASAVNPDVGLGAPGGEPPGTEWLQTPGRRWVPASPRPRYSALRSTGARLITWS